MQKGLDIDYVYVVILIAESKWKTFSKKEILEDKYLGIEEKAFLSYEAAEKFVAELYPYHSVDRAKVLIEKIPIGEL